jgi:hypothetical protein
MRVTIYGLSANHPKFSDLLTKFGGAIAESGDVVGLIWGDKITPWCRENSDLNIIWGSWKDRDTPWHNIKRAVVAEDTPFLVLETPVMGRKPVKDVMDDTWYRVGINGFLGDKGFEHTKNSPGDRYNVKTIDELGIGLLGWKPQGQIVVICLQLPGDASLQGADISKWAVQTAHDVRKVTDRQIVIRTPQLPREFNLDGMPDGVQYQLGTADNLKETMDRAYCFVTYSSGVATDAVINGTPTIAYSPASMVYDIVPHDVSVINNFEPFDRSQWINDMSYCQWSQEELYDGSCWKYIRSKL